MLIRPTTLLLLGVTLAASHGFFAALRGGWALTGFTPAFLAALPFSLGVLVLLSLLAAGGAALMRWWIARCEAAELKRQGRSARVIYRQEVLTLDPSQYCWPEDLSGIERPSDWPEMLDMILATACLLVLAVIAALYAISLVMPFSS